MKKRLTQHEFSGWTLVAVAQGLAWLVGIPLLAKPWWNGFFGAIDPMHAEILLNLSTWFVFFFHFVVLMTISHLEIPFFEKYKIYADRPWPWKHSDEKVRKTFYKLAVKSCVLSIFNFWIMVPAITVAKHKLDKTAGDPFRIDPAHPWPTWTEIVRDNIMLSLVSSLAFYWMHRLSHRIRWYYTFHKTHHEYTENMILSAHHWHPVDFTVSNGIPLVLSTAIVKPHTIVLFQAVFWMANYNADDHSGYSFPWSAVRWIPYVFQRSEQHEYHHGGNDAGGSAFGISYQFMDYVWKSEGKYRDWLVERDLAASKKLQ